MYIRADPSTLMVTNPLRPMIQNKPKATIMDFAPMVNVMPFGMCTTLSNPMVASATAAAMGTLTPMPCIPVPVGPWAPGGKQLITNMPALLDNCKLMCAYGEVSPSICRDIPAIQKGNKQSDRLRNVYGLEAQEKEWYAFCAQAPPLCGYLGAYRNCTLSKKSCNSFEHPYYARFVNGLMFV